MIDEMDEELEQKLLHEALEGHITNNSGEDDEITHQIIELKNCEQWYKSGQNYYRMLELWSLYHAYKVTIPIWLQEKIDLYLLARLKNERSRYSQGNQKRTLKHIMEITEAERTAKAQGKNEKTARQHAISRIAKREGVTEQAIRSRIKSKKRKS